CAATTVPSPRRARTSTPGPTRLIRGARMNIAWNGASPRAFTSKTASNDSSCSPNVLRSTVISMRPAIRCGWPGTSFAVEYANELGIAEMRRRFDDRLRAPCGISRLENARADEVSFRPELHHERRVGGRRDAAGAEEHDRELAVLRYLAHKLHRDAVLLGLLL